MLMSSEEANRSQARNALLLLGSKADPFERRGVSSIFKEFFAFAIVHGNSLDTVSKARLQKFVVTRKIFYERSKYSNFNRNDRKRKKSEKKNAKKIDTSRLILLVTRHTSQEIFRLIYVNGKSPIYYWSK